METILINNNALNLYSLEEIEQRADERIKERLKEEPTLPFAAQSGIREGIITAHYHLMAEFIKRVAESEKATKS